MRTSITMGTALLVTVAAAQSNGFVSGQMSFSSTSSPDDDNKTVSGTFGPAVGFNLNDRFVAGLALTHTGVTNSGEAELNGETFELDQRTNLTTIKPFARYMNKVDEDFSLYGQLAVGIGFGRNTHEELVANNGGVRVEESYTKVSTFSTAIGPGLVYTFAPRWAISADWGALRYESYSSKPDADGAEKFTQNTFGLSLNASSVDFALNWLF